MKKKSCVARAHLLVELVAEQQVPKLVLEERIVFRTDDSEVVRHGDEKRMS